jgi:catechol 2,3-dioxygenase-like lactoylglutathione lyase family enzyme
MKVTSATPVLFVDRVEPTRDFFTRLGFEVAFDVPEGDRLGFAMVTKDGVNVMIETRGNANEPEALQKLSKESRRAAIFVEVDDLEAVISALKGSKVAVERHVTFYKSDELTYEEPGGHLVTFAKFNRS